MTTKKTFNYCDIGARPYLLTNYLCEQIRFLFDEKNFRETPELYSVVWTKNRPSEILVEPAVKYQPENTGQRPAVLVRADDWQYNHVAVGDRTQGTTIDNDVRGGYSVLVSGSHTLFCLSPLPTQAEMIAAEVARQLNQYSSLIRYDLDLLRFRVMGVGGVKVLEESKKHWASPVVVTYSFWENWQLIQKAPRLEKIKLSMFY